MDVGCVIRRADLSEEITLTAEQMALYGNSPDARSALRGPCVFMLYAETAGVLRVDSTTHVVKRWNTLDDGSPEPLHLVMVWRAPDAASASQQEAFLHHLLAPHAVEGRRNWYRAAEAAVALMGLQEWSPVVIGEDRVSVRDMVEEVYADHPADTLTVGLTERVFQRVQAWYETRSGADLRRVHVTLTALRDAGRDPSAILSSAAGVSDPGTREQVREFTRVYNLIRS